VDAFLVIAGGAIGALITLAATVGVRFMAARHEIETHDRLVHDLNEDLERWVADDHVRLRRELAGLRNDLSARKLYYSGEYGYVLGLAKERALETYRDEETRALRESARVFDQEAWMHELWRRRRNMPKPTLTAPARVQPVLDVWKQPPSRHLSPNDTPPAVDDPNVRTLGAIISGLDEDAKDFV
jgi:hypothetical protein